MSNSSASFQSLRRNPSGFLWIGSEVNGPTSPEKSPAICCDLREAGWSGVGLGLRCGRYVLIQPFNKGDFSQTDAVGRVVEVKLPGRYSLTYRTEQSEREVKVFRIERGGGGSVA